jgi:hypothetical protein
MKIDISKIANTDDDGHTFEYRLWQQVITRIPKNRTNYEDDFKRIFLEIYGVDDIDMNRDDGVIEVTAVYFNTDEDATFWIITIHDKLKKLREGSNLV